jgi:SIR2-like domain
VLATNYDDFYWSATASTARPNVYGRGLEDCHRVLRSLDEATPPILWTLQGFLGGQAEKHEAIIKDTIRRRELVNQLVVGHQQYQRAINSENHFRRAFAEVFRRRSLLFLGSGLLEDYLVNLFSEIIHHHGPGPYPHFALINVKERERFDSSFLQTRLGIVPVFYKDHNDIPNYLNELSTLVNYWPGSKKSPQYHQR